jgi:hypothetical protein
MAKLLTPYEFEKKVFEVESVRIFIRLPDVRTLENYKYTNKALDDWSVEEWLSSRVRPYTGDATVIVMDGNAKPYVRGNLKMFRVRRTYLKK